MVLDDELDLECKASQRIPSFMPEQVGKQLVVLFMEGQLRFKCCFGTC